MSLLFIELCAGTAALSLRLHGGKRARPPVSRMGAKTGYASAILNIMGLRAGYDRADHYVWCEPDPGCRLLLEAYRSRELATQAAEVIRGWADVDEEPRALWARLRAEGPVKDTQPREVARWLRIQSWSGLGRLEGARFCDANAIGRPGWKAAPSTAPADRLSTLPTLPSSIEASAEAVDPREVARWIQIVSSNTLINMGADWMNTGAGGTCFGGDFAVPTARILRKIHSLPEMPAELLTDGQALTPPRLPAGVRVVVYIDPPYLNTTGYQHNLSREAVIQLARAWDEVGADVYISEAEAIPLGWHTTDITDTRVGQKRTFSKQQREILTHNRAPQWTPPRQESLW